MRQKYLPNFEPTEYIINPAQQVHGEEEIEAIKQVAESGHWAEGEKAEEFRKALKEFLGVRHVVLTNSGSSANEAALQSLTTEYVPEDRRLYEGDEVITTALCFPTTVSPIVHVGAIPVFVDVEPGTWNIDPEQVRSVINERTKVIIVAHNLGNPFNLDAIIEICEEFGLTLIEDNCDALSSEWAGRKTGTIGHIGTSSFYPAHHISTGEGGAVYTNNAQIYRGIRSMVNWGRDCFAKGTMIRTRNKYTPIEEVVIGDEVLTRSGFKKVNQCIIKDSRRDLVSIKAYGRSPLITTPEHEVLVLNDNEWVWKSAKDIKVGDELFVHREIINTSSNISEDLMFLSGLYLADGCLIKGSKGSGGYYYYAAEFSLHEDEQHLVDRLCDTVERHYGVTSYIRKDKARGIRVRFKSRRLYEFLLNNFGTGSHNKFISDEVLGHVQGLPNLLSGYFVGDGYSNDKKTTVASCNLGLINQIQDIVNWYGIRGGITTQSRESKIIIGGNVVKNASPIHSLNFYGSSKEMLDELMNSSSPSKVKSYIGAIVEEVEKSNYNGNLYDLSIEDQHEYIANGLLVHNCWCEPGQDDTCNKRYGWQMGDLPFGYDHKNIYAEMGFNLKSTDFGAAAGIEQLKRLPEFTQIRRFNHAYLRTVFEAVNEGKQWFEIPRSYDKADPSWFGYVIKLNEGTPFSKDEMVQFLEKRGIRSRAFFAGNITKHPAFYGREDANYRTSEDLSVSDSMTDRAFWIGVHPDIDEYKLEYIKNVIFEFVSLYTTER